MHNCMSSHIKPGHLVLEYLQEGLVWLALSQLLEIWCLAVTSITNKVVLYTLGTELCLY